MAEEATKDPTPALERLAGQWRKRLADPALQAQIKAGTVAVSPLVQQLLRAFPAAPAVKGPVPYCVQMHRSWEDAHYGPVLPGHLQMQRSYQDRVQYATEDAQGHVHGMHGMFAPKNGAGAVSGPAAAPAAPHPPAPPKPVGATGYTPPAALAAPAAPAAPAPAPAPVPAAPAPAGAPAGAPAAVQPRPGLEQRHAALARIYNKHIDRAHRGVQQGALSRQEAHAQAQEHATRAKNAVSAHANREWRRLKSEILAQHGDSPVTRDLLAHAKDRLRQARDQAHDAIDERSEHPGRNAGEDIRRGGRLDVESSLSHLAGELGSVRRFIGGAVEPARRHAQLQEAQKTAQRLGRKLASGMKLTPEESEQLKAMTAADRYHRIVRTKEGRLGIQNPEGAQRGEAHLLTPEGTWAVHHNTPTGWVKGFRPAAPAPAAPAAPAAPPV